MMDRLERCINEVFGIPAQESLFQYNELVDKAIRKHWNKEIESLETKNKKLVHFLLDPMMPEDDYPNQIRFNREVYNILYDELLKGE